jgi:hypothetical protein
VAVLRQRDVQGQAVREQIACSRLSLWGGLCGWCDVRRGINAEPNSLSGIGLSEGSRDMRSQERNIILGEGSNIVQVCRFRSFAQEQEESGSFFGVDTS